MATIAELMVKIGADTAEFNRAMNETERQMRSSARVVDDVSRQIRASMKAAENAIRADFTALANSSAQYAGRTDEFMAKIDELGRKQKKLSDEMINANERAKASFLQSIGAILARSTQSEKIAANFDRMRNPLYTVNNALLEVGKSLENKAKQGTAAYLALQQLGPTASMKELRDMTTMINAGLMRMQMTALVMGIAFGVATYGIVQLSNAIDGRLIPAAKQFQASWIPALQPFISSWTTVVEWIIRGAAAVGDFVGVWAQANPELAAAVGWFGYLFIGLTAILAPLAVGIGLTGGLAASFTALWAIIGPFVIGFLSVAGTAAVVAAALVALGWVLHELWTTNDGFKNAVITAWEAIKSAAATVWNAITQTITAAANTVISFLESEFSGFGAFWAQHGDQIVQAATNVWTAIWTFLQPYVTMITQFLKLTWELAKDAIALVWDLIKNIISSALEIIMGVLKVFAGLFTGDWRLLWEGILQILEGICRLIGGTLEALYKGAQRIIMTLIDWSVSAFDAMKTSVIGIFNRMGVDIQSVWEGVKTTTKGAINYLISAINKFINAYNAIKIEVPAVDIPMVGKVGGFSIGVPQIPNIPALATGTNYFPKDGLAFLHQGEQVVPKKYNPNAGGVAPEGNRPINIFIDGKLVYSGFDDYLGSRVNALGGV